MMTPQQRRQAQLIVDNGTDRLREMEERLDDLAGDATRQADILTLQRKIALKREEIEEARRSLDEDAATQRQVEAAKLDPPADLVATMEGIRQQVAAAALQCVGGAREIAAGARSLLDAGHRMAELGSVAKRVADGFLPRLQQHLTNELCLDPAQGPVRGNVVFPALIGGAGPEARRDFADIVVEMLDHNLRVYAELAPAEEAVARLAERGNSYSIARRPDGTFELCAQDRVFGRLSAADAAMRRLAAQQPGQNFAIAKVLGSDFVAIIGGL